jgi:hypothetical protein
MNRKSIVGMVFVVACCLLAGFLLAGCSTFGGKEKPTVSVAEIVQMSKSGTSAADIIAKIRESGTVYRLKASELASLKDQGVPADVIDYMQQTYLRAIQSDQRLQDNYRYEGMSPDWSYDPFWYGPGEIGERGEGSRHDRR